MVTPVFYSPAIRGFYDPDTGVTLPVDAIEISRTFYGELMDGQAQGAQIVPGPEGLPMLEWPVPPSAEQVLQTWRAGMAVSAFQAKAALYNRGLLDDAEAVAVAAGGLTLLAWQTAVSFQRLSPTITGLAPAIGITDPLDLDDLFVEAALISA